MPPIEFNEETAIQFRRMAEADRDAAIARAVTRFEAKMELLAKIKSDEATKGIQPSIVDAINTLRCEEGSSLTIFCQNPEGCGPDNEAITVSAGWTNWEDRRFTGTTLAECFARALVAMPDHCKPKENKS